MCFVCSSSRCYFFPVKEKESCAGKHDQHASEEIEEISAGAADNSCMKKSVPEVPELE